MTVAIDIPATAQAALDSGAMYVLCASLTLPDAQSKDGSGAPWLWTTADSNVPYGGAEYVRDGTLHGTEWSSPAQQAEGRIALALLDPHGAWEARMLAAGVRGHAVLLAHLLPHGDGLWWPMNVFRGSTESVESRVDPAEGKITRVLCEDRIFQAKVVPGEFTTDGFQRKLSEKAGLSEANYDNSHAEANVVKTKRWHTR